MVEVSCAAGLSGGARQGGSGRREGESRIMGLNLFFMLNPKGYIDSHYMERPPT
jgi:hypothetical protein